MNSVSDLYSLNLPWDGMMINIAGFCSVWYLPAGFYEHQSE